MRIIEILRGHLWEILGRRLRLNFKKTTLRCKRCGTILDIRSGSSGCTYFIGYLRGVDKDYEASKEYGCRYRAIKGALG